MLTNGIASGNQASRLFWLYQYLPRQEKQAKTISDIMKTYVSDSTRYDSERKNLENDLKALAQILDYRGLMRIPDWSEEKISGRTAKYYINSNFALENISGETIFFWEMLSNFTQNYLPVSIQQHLEQQLKAQQQNFMRQYQQSELGRWKNHLITLPAVVAPPKIDTTILETIHQAILQKKVLEIDYQRKWEAVSEVRRIYPIGLVFVDNMVYLTGFNPVAESLHDENMLAAHRNFAVNRIKTARILQEPLPGWLERDNFSLEHLHQLGKLECHGDYIKESLILLVSSNVVEHLRERPLSMNQSFEEFDDQWCIVVAQNVPNTERLHHWLFSMSSFIKIVAPRYLRKQIEARLMDGLALYQCQDGLV